MNFVKNDAAQLRIFPEVTKNQEKQNGSDADSQIEVSISKKEMIPFADEGAIKPAHVLDMETKRSEFEEGFRNCVYRTSFDGLVSALQRGRGTFKTRFAPEPSGALHLGHVRALAINLMTAQFYSGQCNLRFDDSNPETASELSCLSIA
jgi:hypothetical protein